MMQISKILFLPKNRLFEKIYLSFILVLSLWGFWYFEPSLTLRVLALGLSAVGIFVAFFRVADKPQLSSHREFLILLTLYFGLYSLYNLLYGLSLPIYIIMLAALFLVSSLFFGLVILDRLDTLLKPAVFQLFIVMMGLVIMQIFLSLTFWPIDPKVKSLVIVIIFYLITNLIYLYTHDMLRFKRIVGYLVVGIVILTILLIFTWRGLLSQ